MITIYSSYKEPILIQGILSLQSHSVDFGEPMVCCHICDIYVSSGTGPEGRIIKKDIDSFVPSKAAPVSYIWLLKIVIIVGTESRALHMLGKHSCD